MSKTPAEQLPTHHRPHDAGSARYAGRQAVHCPQQIPAWRRVVHQHHRRRVDKRPGQDMHRQDAGKGRPDQAFVVREEDEVGQQEVRDDAERQEDAIRAPDPETADQPRVQEQLQRQSYHANGRVGESDLLAREPQAAREPEWQVEVVVVRLGRREKAEEDGVERRDVERLEKSLQHVEADVPGQNGLERSPHLVLDLGEGGLVRLIVVVPKKSLCC